MLIQPKHISRAFISGAILVPCIMAANWILDLEGPNQPNSGRGPYLASTACKACHIKEYESWSETYHQSMTRPATRPNLRAPIHGQVDLNIDGQAVTFFETNRGFEVELPYLDGNRRRLPIKWFIGSRRMQQFAVEYNGQIHRIPVFYSIADQRWASINDAFFRKKKRTLAHFAKGFALWNANCLFCHNTRPNPRMDYPDWTFDSTMGEPGIACEECHGPAGNHAASNRNPFRRYGLWMRGRGDASIVQPAKLDQQDSVELCGQCHGQRIPKPRDRIVELMTEGDPYYPGKTWSDYFEPLTIQSSLDKALPLRFWNDGSPRLTAYELQSIQASACYQNSELTCLSCHSGHLGNPEGMIRTAMLTNDACTQCHASLIDPDEQVRHSGHRVRDASCFDCHMPDRIYGVLSIHPDHQIRIPDPRKTLLFEMPNACNLCHLQKSLNWALQHFNADQTPRRRLAGPDYDFPEMLRGFVQGDVVYRAVLLNAMRKRNKAHSWILNRAQEDPFGVIQLFAERWQDETTLDFPIDPSAVKNLAQRKRADPVFDFGE